MISSVQNPYREQALRYTDSRYQGIYDGLVADAAAFRRGELG